MLVLITEERRDAIGIYNDKIAREFSALPDFKRIHLNNQRFGFKLARVLHQAYNLLSLWWRLSRDDILLFTDPVAFKANIVLFTKNPACLVFQHIDFKPGYYRFLPFSFDDLINGFDWIFSASGFSRMQLAEMNFPMEKTHVVHNGLDHEIFYPSKAASPCADPYVLYAGTETERKNMPVLLETFALLKKDFPRLKLVKVGGAGGEQYRARTVAKIQALGLEDEVIFTNFLPETDLATYYSNAGVFLFPTLREGFGLPVIEAMACGVPVVSSNIEPIIELLQGTQLLGDPESPAELAALCKDVLSDQAKRKRMRGDGLKAAATYGWSITANKILDHISRHLDIEFEGRDGVNRSRS